MELILFQFIKIFFMVSAGALSQTSWMQSIYAESTIDKRLCFFPGRYVVFAQGPLLRLSKNGIDVQLPREQGTLPDRNNIQLAHEHIFFCNNNKIERNVGFGPNGRFIEEVVNEKYALIDNDRFDSDIINNILGPDQCYIDDKKYEWRSNNCQDFTERVRNKYWERMFEGTWVAKSNCDFGAYYSQVVNITIRDSSLVATKVDDGAHKCFMDASNNTIEPVFSGFSGSIPSKVTKGSSFSVTYNIVKNPASGKKQAKLKIINPDIFITTFPNDGKRFDQISYIRLKTACTELTYPCKINQ
jgi:hypothetical protein